MGTVGTVAGMVLLLCFITGLFCLFVRSGSGSSSRRRGGGGGGGEAVVEPASGGSGRNGRAAAAGLEEMVVKALPLYELSSATHDALPATREPCSICLCAFQEGQMVRVLPSCCHTFHLSCIDQWLHSHANCPLCRKQITLVDQA